MNRQQDVDKHAKIAMLIISGIIIFLFAIALSGCYNECAHKDVYIPGDTAIHKTENILYWEWDSVMDSVEMDCGD